MRRHTLRQYARDLKRIQPIMSADDLARILFMERTSSMSRGYEMAVADFFGANLPNGEADEDWFVHQPSLKRTLGGYQRWYGRPL